jgi:hypothetical protein
MGVVSPRQGPLMLAGYGWLYCGQSAGEEAPVRSERGSGC